LFRRATIGPLDNFARPFRLPSSISEFIMELAGVTEISLRSTSGSRATRTMHLLGFGFKGKGREFGVLDDLMRSRFTRHFRTWYSTSRSTLRSPCTLKYGCRGILTTIFFVLGDIVWLGNRKNSISKWQKENAAIRRRQICSAGKRCRRCRIIDSGHCSKMPAALAFFPAKSQNYL